MFHPSHKHLSCQAADRLRESKFAGTTIGSREVQQVLKSLFGCQHRNSIGHLRYREVRMRCVSAAEILAQPSETERGRGGTGEPRVVGTDSRDDDRRPDFDRTVSQRTHGILTVRSAHAVSSDSGL